MILMFIFRYPIPNSVVSAFILYYINRQYIYIVLLTIFLRPSFAFILYK